MVRLLFAALIGLASVFIARAAAADQLAHDTVSGAAIERVMLAPPGANAAEVAWADVSSAQSPGLHVVRFNAKGEAVEIPHCNGRARVLVDNAVKDPGSRGPLVLKLGSDADAAHDIRLEINVSTYEKRIACSHAPRVGAIVRSSEGLSHFKFTSTHSGPMAGEAVVFVPGGHDRTKAGALLVGAHPWNTGPWTYAAYKELLEEAGAKDVVLLMPSGLGNSLYTADAEDEVMKAIDAIGAEIAIDKQRVSIWGASMGGAGATTISFHRPDRFAFASSYFGDSKYDLTTYVKSLLPNDATAKKVNALDVLENARHLPVWLIHGEDDHTSSIAQSVMLNDAMKKAGFKVDFDRVAGMGHEGPLVVKFIKRVVDRAADAKAPVFPARVSFRSVRGIDTQAYGVRIVRAGEADAFVDVEKRDDGVHVLRADNILQIVLRAGALGAAENEKVIVDAPGSTVAVRWGQ